MKQTTTPLRALLAIAIALAVPVTATATSSGCGWGIKKHDKLIELDADCDEAWADLEAQYQRRADMLPNLVKVAKASAAHEKDTFKEVAKARASATSMTVDVHDAESMAKFQQAQGDVTQALGKLAMISESYPELKASEQFSTLMTNIEGTENRILVARKKYNKAVTAYNKELKKFGGKVFDSVTGDTMFEPRVAFKAQAGADQAPDLDL